MRVGFLTHYYPPEVGAPQTRISLLARSLAAAGAEVTVHTGFPHYPDGVIRAPYRNRPWLMERVDGVAVLRSAVYPARNEGFAPRLLDHTAFAASALACARLPGVLDVLVAESPPLFTGAAGVLYAALKRAALVVNIADRWPASAVELGALRNPRAIRAAEVLERWIYRRADLITSPTEGIATTLAGVPDAAGRSRRLWPVVELERFDPHVRPAPEAGAALSLLYAGTIGLAHGLEVLVRAAQLAGPGVVQVTIAGDGADAERIRELVSRDRVGNVTVLGTVPATAIPDLFARAHASAVLLRDLPIFAGALPTKMLEAMAAGRPLVLSARGEAARLVQQAGAGLVVPPGDPEALAGALRRLHSDPGLVLGLGRAGRAYAEAHFGAARAVAAWREALEEAIASRAQRRG